MGFVGAQKTGATSSCSSYSGHNFCGSTPPLVSELSCAGDESDIISCPHEAGSDVILLVSKLEFHIAIEVVTRNWFELYHSHCNLELCCRSWPGVLRSRRKCCDFLCW